MDEVHKQNPKALPWQCLRDYYGVCTEGLINPLALTIFEKFIETATLVESPDGEMVPYDPFPKGNYQAGDDIPVVVAEGFKIIQRELNNVFKVKRIKVEREMKKSSTRVRK